MKSNRNQFEVFLRIFGMRWHPKDITFNETNYFKLSMIITTVSCVTSFGTLLFLPWNLKYGKNYYFFLIFRYIFLTIGKNKYFRIYILIKKSLLNSNPSSYYSVINLSTCIHLVDNLSSCIRLVDTFIRLYSLVSA